MMSVHQKLIEFSESDKNQVNSEEVDDVDNIQQNGESKNSDKTNIINNIEI